MTKSGVEPTKKPSVGLAAVNASFTPPSFTLPIFSATMPKKSPVSRLPMARPLIVMLAQPNVDIQRIGELNMNDSIPFTRSPYSEALTKQCSKSAVKRIPRRLGRSASESGDTDARHRDFGSDVFVDANRALPSNSPSRFSDSLKKRGIFYLRLAQEFRCTRRKVRGNQIALVFSRRVILGSILAGAPLNEILPERHPTDAR
jgi:hypothetical protein